MNDSLVGREIAEGRYVIEGLLSASGGMSFIYRAQRRDLGDQVAIKLLRPELTSTQDARQYYQRFAQEARTAAVLSDHPNIINIYDFGVEGNLAYIVMPLLSGGSLQERIGIYDNVADVLNVLRQIADGLDHAGQQGVVHRDVKPANILFDEFGTAIIADFGIAKLTRSDATSLTRDGQAIGTALYMPPELWQGRTHQHTDQYSLAVVAYQLLSYGAYIFEFEDDISYTALLHAHLNEEPISLSVRRQDLPEGVASTINRALSKDPTWRFSSNREFINHLEQSLYQQPATINLNNSGAESARSAQRSSRSGIIAMLAVLVVFIAGGSGLLFLINDNEGDEPDSGAILVETEASTEQLTEETTETLTLQPSLQMVTSTEQLSQTSTASQTSEPTMALVVSTSTEQPTNTATTRPSSTHTSTNTATSRPSSTSTSTASPTLRPTNTTRPTQTPSSTMLPTSISTPMMQPIGGMLFIPSNNGQAEFFIDARLRGRTGSRAMAIEICSDNGLVLASSDAWLAAADSDVVGFEPSDIEEWTFDIGGVDLFVVLTKNPDAPTRLAPPTSETTLGFRCVSPSGSAG